MASSNLSRVLPSELEHFSNILLVASPEDRYVPHHSARIQLCAEAIHDPLSGSVYVSMMHNLLAPLRHCNIVHIDVSFGIDLYTSTKLAEQVDAAIGRAAHISFLENRAFLSMFANTYVPLFSS